MRWLIRLLRRLGPCRHESTYRERRDLGGLSVAHFVCASCGASWPVVQRTTEEHARMVRVGAVRRPKAQRPSGKVLPMRRVQ